MVLLSVHFSVNRNKTEKSEPYTVRVSQRGVRSLQILHLSSDSTPTQNSAAAESSQPAPSPAATDLYAPLARLLL